MILEKTIALFCTQFSLMTPGSSPGPCQAAINAGSIETQTTSTLNALESYMTQTTYKVINKDLIYGTAGIIYLINSYNNKSILAQIPINKFEIDTNLSYTSNSFGLKYKYEF